MEEKIRDIVRQCKGINLRVRTRRAVFNNYDILYSAMRENGLEYFVAHTWTLMELARLHGRVKVEEVLKCPT